MRSKHEVQLRYLAVIFLHICKCGNFSHKYISRNVSASYRSNFTFRRNNNPYNIKASAEVAKIWSRIRHLAQWLWVPSVKMVGTDDCSISETIYWVSKCTNCQWRDSGQYRISILYRYFLYRRYFLVPALETGVPIDMWTTSTLKYSSTYKTVKSTLTKFSS